MRRWTNNQFAELRTDFPQQPIGLSKKPHTVQVAVRQLLIETVQFLWPCVNSKRGDSVHLTRLVFVEGIAPAYN